MNPWKMAISCSLASLILTSSLNAQHREIDPKDPVPPGWYIFDSGGKDPASILTCIMTYADTPYTWAVSSVDDSLIIKAWERKFSPGTKVPEGTTRINGVAGWVSEKDFPDGKLQGFDGGEYGGGLWFLPKNSSERIQLTSLAVMDIVPVASGALILTRSVDLKSGSVFLASEDSSNKWTLRLVTDLAASPVAIVRDGDSSSILVTADRVLRLDDSGTLKLLGTLPHYRPNSVVIEKNGDIYVGMTLVVYRLRRMGESYAPEALIPDNCNLEITPYCSCGVRK
jgi:hypothetical protein